MGGKIKFSHAKLRIAYYSLDNFLLKNCILFIFGKCIQRMPFLKEEEEEEEKKLGDISELFSFSFSFSMGKRQKNPSVHSLLASVCNWLTLLNVIAYQ